MPVETIYVVGHAQLPQGMAAKTQFETLAVTAEVETRHGVILKATATLVTEEGKDYFSRMLVGRSLHDNVEEVLLELRNAYQGAAQNALAAGTKDMWRRYATWSASRPAE